MSDFPEFDLERFTPYRLAVVAQKTSEELARQYRTRFGISIPEWRVLAHLSQAGDTPVSVRDIEVRATLEKTKVSRAASRLEKAGYIRKDANESDGRLVRLALTKRGRTLLQDLLPVARDYQIEIETRLGDAFAGFEAGVDRLLSD